LNILRDCQRSLPQKIVLAVDIRQKLCKVDWLSFLHIQIDKMAQSSLPS
jgi:hypothetical protein